MRELRKIAGWTVFPATLSLEESLWTSCAEHLDGRTIVCRIAAKFGAVEAESGVLAMLERQDAR